MDALNTVPTIGNSKTIKWGILGPVLVGMLQLTKIIPGVGDHFGPAIDKLCEAILLATAGGVTVGLRLAAGANAAAIQKIGDATGARLPIGK